MKILLWLVGIGAVCFVILLIIGANTDPHGDAIVLGVAKDAVRAQSKDPGAIQFGDVWAGSVKGTKVACGTFNGKNSFGAYVGSQRFIAGGDLVLTQERAGPVIDGMWWDACEKYRGR